MKKTSIPKELLDLIKSINNKRAKIVLDHILKHGKITTEELEKEYGYNHPPRAARDVREAGIPLETIRVKSSDGRSIGAYTFGDFSKIQEGKLDGRKIFPKELKDSLFISNSGKCKMCSGLFEARYLQIDHRIPYEIAGDIDFFNKADEDYMLLCASCNRAKSWSCENCKNAKNQKICTACYWAIPEHYTHIALKEVRRLDLVWENDEIVIYDSLKKLALHEKIPLPDFVKEKLEELFK
jgi:hypothetical protein